MSNFQFAAMGDNQVKAALKSLATVGDKRDNLITNLLLNAARHAYQGNPNPLTFLYQTMKDRPSLFPTGYAPALTAALTERGSNDGKPWVKIGVKVKKIDAGGGLFREERFVKADIKGADKRKSPIDFSGEQPMLNGVVITSWEQLKPETKKSETVDPIKSLERLADALTEKTVKGLTSADAKKMREELSEIVTRYARRATDETTATPIKVKAPKRTARKPKEAKAASPEAVAELVAKYA